MKLVSLLLASLFAIQACADALSANTLPDSVREALQSARIPLDSVGIYVQDIHAAAPLLAINGQQAMNPASTMKLLTTYAALEVLGPSYTWPTEAWLDGKLEEGVLDGNLIIKGHGNPKLTVEHLWTWLHEMRNRGLREIRGNVILDRSAFEPQDIDTAAFDNDPNRAYNVAPDTLLLNFNAIRFHFSPDAAGISVYTEPALDGIVLDNRLKPIQTRHCADWDDHLKFSLTGEDGIIRINGRYPVNCGEHDKTLSLLPHQAYFEAVFRAIWRETGGSLSGTFESGIVTPTAELFSTQHSQPLSEIIRDINKFSNNVMARQLFLSLSLDRSSPSANYPVNTPATQASGVPAATPLQPASIAASNAILQEWLARKGLEIPELVIENGSGLSRIARISPYSLAMVLRDIELNPLSAEIEASLPIVGMDGTMRRRHLECEVKAHAHMKTGSLEGVKSMAGYLQSRSGKQWLVVFFINHPHARQGQQAQDALLDWLMENG